MLLLLLLMLRHAAARYAIDAAAMPYACRHGFHFARARHLPLIFAAAAIMRAAATRLLLRVFR